MDKLGLEQTAVLSARLTEKPGDLIGRYKLLERIGEGGFGIVYVAEQKEPVKRRVALKIIKLGMDTRQVVARFEAERQALALMDHPNIARILDGGATESGRPYFVMELVHGIKVTDYCDQNHLSTRERLELFAQICRAIQHAHQKGVIHRDIKPSNILVTLHDGVPVPKVIDFGIAKATQQELTEQTVYTGFGQFLGTPAYMSPEQAEMSGLDIDTRSDIYSLGVLLYELLTGRTPFEAKELLQSGLDRMRQIIREREPVPPSTRLRQQTKSQGVSAPAQSKIQNPKSKIENDLDWIVMKCLEKDRMRRYETANGLARDIERHLHQEPVVARPPSAAYRFEKFVRRNKVVVSATAAVALALVLGAAISTWQAVQATRAKGEQVRLRQLSDASAQQASQAQAKEAQQRQRAEAEELAARRRAYASDMNLAQQALAMNNLGRALELLNRQWPETGQVDLRGWEWRYLWQQCRSDALFTLCKKTNAIVSLSVSHDGKWLAIGEEQTAAVSIWDLQRRQQAACLEPGQNPLTSPWVLAARMAFSPREALLAFSMVINQDRTNRDDVVRLWNADTGQLRAQLPGIGRSTGMAFSDDGTKLLTSAEDGLTLWRVSDGTNLAKCAAPASPISIGTPFAADRDLTLAAVASNNTVRVVELPTGKERWRTNMANDHVTALAFSPDGTVVVSADGYANASIRFWDVRSGQEIGAPLTDHSVWVGALVFWPDGKTLASASADQTIRLWDVSNLTSVRPLGQPLRGHRSEVWRLALLPDNRTLVSGGKDGTVRIWDTTTARREHLPMSLPTPLAGWCFRTNSKSVLTLDREGQAARWQGSNFEEKHPLVELGQDIFGVCFSEDGRFLACGSHSGLVQVADLERRAVIRQWKASTNRVDPWVKPWRFLKHGRELITRQDQLTAIVWDLVTGQPTQSWPYPPYAFGRAISPDERWYAHLGHGGVLGEVASGPQTNLNIDIQQAHDAAFSPDGTMLAAVSWLGYARLWEIPTLQEVKTLRGVLLNYNSLAFSPDGTRLATAGSGQEAMKLWDLKSYLELLTLEGRGSLFEQTAFSPDGNLLGSMNEQGILHIWRAPSWAEIEAAHRATEAESSRP